MQAGGSRSMIGRTRQSQDLNNEKHDQTNGWANQDRSLRESKKAAHRAERKSAKLDTRLPIWRRDPNEVQR